MSERGVALCDRVATGFTEILQKARSVDELVGEIATASREQNDGIGQINKAVRDMDRVTQTNAAAAEESAAAAEELNAQSVTLKDCVSQLLRLVNGGDDTGAPVSSGRPVVTPVLRRPAPAAGQPAGDDFFKAVPAGLPPVTAHAQPASSDARR